jgi:hypothetical protein
MFNFQAGLARTQPFLSRSVEKRGDQSRFKSRRMVNYDAIRSTEQKGGEPRRAAVATSTIVLCGKEEALLQQLHQALLTQSVSNQCEANGAEFQQ